MSKPPQTHKFEGEERTIEEIIQMAMTDEDGNPRVSEEERLIHKYATPLAELAVKNRERINALERQVKELENPQDRNNFHHYVRPLADRLGELETVVEEIYKRTGMNFAVDNGELKK